MVYQNIRPKISVCIPTYNGSVFLSQAVTSVLMQDYQDYELVIVDNCSDDDSVEIIRALMKGYERIIRFYRNESNIGLAGNLNKCIEYARGAFIKILCVDDYLFQGCLSQMVSKLEANKSVVLVSCARQLVDESGKELTVERYAGHELFVSGTQAITRCLYGRNYIGEPSAVMFRNDVSDGVFRDDLPQLLDLDMWFNLMEKGDYLYINEPLCAIRRHSMQVSNVNFKAGLVVTNHIKIYDLYSQKSYVNPKIIDVIRFKLLMSYRLWISRKYISEDYKRKIITGYASIYMYKLMPIALFYYNLLKGSVCFFRRLISK